jgi:hypothetical protein
VGTTDGQVLGVELGEEDAPRTEVGALGSKIVQLALTPGTVFALAGKRRVVALDPARAAPRWTIEVPPSRLLAAAADRLAVASKRGVTIHRASDGERLQKLRSGPEPASALALSRDGDMLALGDARGEVRVHDVRSGRLLASVRAHAGRVVGARFPSPDALHTVGEDGRVRRLELRDLERPAADLGARLKARYGLRLKKASVLPD